MSKNEDRKQLILPQIQKNGSQDLKNENYNFIAPKKKAVAFKDKEEPDHELVDELKRKIEEQKKDIEQRNQAIFSIQRNFESLSTLLKNEKLENQGIKDELLRQKDSNLELLLKIKQLSQKVQDLEQSQEQLKKEIDGFAEERKLQKRIAGDLQNTKQRSDELEKMLQKKQEDIGSLMLKVKEFNNISEKLKTLESEKAQNQKQQEQLDKRVNDLENESIIIQTENESLKEKLLKKSQLFNEIQIERDQQKIIVLDLKQKENSYHQQIAQQTQLIEEQKKKIKQLQDSLDTEKAVNSMKDNSENNIKQQNSSMSQKLIDKEKMIEQQLKEIYSLQVKLSSYTPYMQFIENLTKLQESCKSEILLIPKFELEQSLSNLSALQCINTSLEEEIILQNQKNASINQSQIQLEAKLTSMKLKLDEKDREIDQYIEALSEKDNQKLNSDKSVSQNQDLLKQSQDRIKKNAQQINQLETENQKLKVSSEVISNQLKNSQTLLEQKINQLQQIEGKNEQNTNDLQQKDNEVNNLKDRLQSHIISSEQLNKQLQDALKRQENIQLAAEQSKQLYDQKLSNLESQQGTDGEQLRQLKIILDIKEREFTLKTQIIKENEQLTSSLKSKLMDKENENTRLKLEIDSKFIIYSQGQKELIVRDDLLYKQNLDIQSLTNKVKQLEVQIDELNPAQIKKQLQEMEQRDKNFQNVLSKIEHAQESTIISITCGQCMEYLTSTMTCVPCGHSFCQKCPQGYQSGCSECQNGDTCFKNRQMDDIVAKIKYSQATLKSLKT